MPIMYESPGRNTYPFPELIPQLQFMCNPAEYRRLPEPKAYREEPEFWAMMPTYRYAECPFCGHEYREKANTYALLGWGYNGLASNLYAGGVTRKDEVSRHCSHFLGVRKFINLHGIRPVEKKYFSNE